MIENLIRKIFKCKHKNALLHSNEGYCPDCGQFLRKSYYLVRCECCGMKRYAKIKFGEIVPVEKFCTNCGTNEFRIEKYENLSLVDINYAIEIKELSSEFGETEDYEIWIEDNNTCEKNQENKTDKFIPNIKYITG